MTKQPRIYRGERTVSSFNVGKTEQSLTKTETVSYVDNRLKKNKNIIMETFRSLLKKP